MFDSESNPFENPLFFSMISNNDNSITLLVRRKDKSLVNFTGYTIEWGMFKNGVEVISKSTESSNITIPDQSIPENLSTIILSIAASDTTNLETEVFYIHEFSFTDPFGNSSNVSKNDEFLTVGKVYLRRQYKAQGSP